ncbi:MAG: Uncharacterised protein [Cyanobium sp. ARS6]|nr:MAG: Uncharacterised protein [Cyanobium sp. ARS6]
MNEEGSKHGDHNGNEDACGTAECARFDQAHHQIADAEAGCEKAHGVFSAAEFVGDQTTGWTSDQVHEGETGGQDSCGCFRQVECGFKERWQHRNHSQFGTEVHDVGEFEDGHLAELITIFLGIYLDSHDQIAVGADDSPGLEDEPDEYSQQGQWISSSVQESNFLESPAENTEDCCEGNIHAQQSPEISHRRDFKTCSLFRTLIVLSGRGVGDVEEVNHAIHGRDDSR